MVKHKPFHINRVLKKINFHLSAKERKVAMDRIEEVMPGNMKRKTMLRVKLPHLIGVHPGTVLKICYENQIKNKLARHRTIMVKVNKIVTRSIKKWLVNEREFIPTIDIEDFRCTCCSSAKLLGIDLKEGEHLCHLASMIALGREIQKSIGGIEVNYETNVVPNFNSLFREFKVNVNKAVKRLSMFVDHDLLFHFLLNLYRKKYKNIWGVHEFFVQKWSLLTKEDVIVLPVEKGRNQLALCCPAFFQKRVCRFITMSNASFCIPDDLVERFDAFGRHMEYTRIVWQHRGHEFGALRLWPKWSGFDVHGCFSVIKKWRPVASYYRHKFKRTLSLAGRAILWMLRTLFPTNISVLSSHAIQKKVLHFNQIVKERQAENLTPMIFVRKFDVDGFVNAVPHAKVLDSYGVLLEKWRGVFGRRREIICIPVQKCPRSWNVVSSENRSIGLRLKRFACEKRDYVLRHQNIRACAKSHFPNFVSDVLFCIEFDLSLGFNRFGSTLFRQDNVGIPKGSPLSPA